MTEPFTMPIQNRKGPDLDGPFVWAPTQADKDRAYRNHGQTLGRLAERGGMAWCEMAYILLNQRFERGTRISQEPAYAKAVCHDVLLMRARGANFAAPPPATIEWTRLGDALPEIGDPILLAHWEPERGGWRVRDACLRIRFEEVVPRPSDMDQESAPHWWFDCIYPGKGDMRLGTPDALWAPMPVPPPPAVEGAQP